MRNLATYSRNPNATTVIAADSMTLLAAMPGLIARMRPCRLFSLDGGHSPQHVLNDLRIAEQVLAPGGVVFVDDMWNPEWPGVTEGMHAYMRTLPSLVPFASLGGKLLLTTFSEAHTLFGGRYAQALQQAKRDGKLRGRVFMNNPGRSKHSQAPSWFGHALTTVVL